MAERLCEGSYTISRLWNSTDSACQDVAESLGISNLSDELSTALAADVEYRLREVIEVRYERCTAQYVVLKLLVCAGVPQVHAPRPTDSLESRRRRPCFQSQEH